MAADRAVHLVRSADPEELLHAVERWRAGGLYCIPAVWQRILDCDDGHDTSSLVEALTGTSLVSLDLIDAIKARFPGSWTSVAYGSTEMGRGLVLVDSDLHSHPESVGQPPPMVTTHVADDGELWLRGPTMFSGYLDRPDATAEAIDPDGWFHTGDLVTCDADGYFTITGRASESIRSGGEWVAPVEVETAVASHPAVAEVAVVGIPDPAWGEVVCRGDRGRARGRAAHRRRGARPTWPSTLVGPEATTPGRAGRRAPPHRRHRAGPPSDVAGLAGCFVERGRVGAAVSRLIAPPPPRASDRDHVLGERSHERRHVLRRARPEVVADLGAHHRGTRRDQRRRHHRARRRTCEHRAGDRARARRARAAREGRVATASWGACRRRARRSPRRRHRSAPACP